MALGELIIEDRGKITGQRVLDVKGLKTETSFAMRENTKELKVLMLGPMRLY